MKLFDNIFSRKPRGVTYKHPSCVYVPHVKMLPGIDVSNVNKGYVSASFKSKKRLKFQVECNDIVYNYDLPMDGKVTIFPINLGNGSYTFRIMQNIHDNEYIEIESSSIDISLIDEFSPYLIPNQLCQYNENSLCVKKAYELTSKATNEAEVVSIICTYIAKNISYDDIKCEKYIHLKNYIPDPDKTYVSRSGICFDYASLAAAMLRSLRIPTKIVTGYVGQDKKYHAWIKVYVDGVWKTTKFAIYPNVWSSLDVTFAATGKRIHDNMYIEKYIY